MPLYKELYFGPAGIPHSTPRKSTADGVKEVRSLSLDAMEIEFVYGVNLRPEAAEKVRKIAEKEEVRLSVHAPYYINLNAQDEKKMVASKRRIVDSAIVGSLAGAHSIVFHPGFYLKMEKSRVYKNIKKTLEEVVEMVKERGAEVILRPETTGKHTQFGSLEELFSLSSEIEGVLPCLDFSHLHARAGGRVNSYEEFCTILSSYESHLQKESLKNMHIHVSGIEYTDKGEKNHLNLRDSDFKYFELIKALKEFECAGLVISESPNLEEDALLLKKIYKEMRE